MHEAFLALPLSVLERFHDAVRSGRLRAPLTESGLMAEHLDTIRPHLPLLSAFDGDAGLRTFLGSVVELRRRDVHRTRPELVWTGPEPRHGRARRTSVVMPELFARAQREVFLAGYSFMGRQTVLGPLHEAARDRGVRVEIVIDGSGVDVQRPTSPEEILERVVAEFWKWTWKWKDEPRPVLLHDPRTLVRTWDDRRQRWRSEASMHAKCLVVDRQAVLLGSANFTERAQSDNIEVGVLMHDPELAEEVLHHWRAVISEGLVAPVKTEA